MDEILQKFISKTKFIRLNDHSKKEEAQIR